MVDVAYLTLLNLIIDTILSATITFNCTARSVYYDGNINERKKEEGEQKKKKRYKHNDKNSEPQRSEGGTHSFPPLILITSPVSPDVYEIYFFIFLGLG